MFCGVCAVDHNPFGQHLPPYRAFGVIEAWCDDEDSPISTLLVFENVRDELGLGGQLDSTLRQSEFTGAKRLAKGGYLVRAVGVRSGFSSQQKASDQDFSPTVSDLYQSAYARLHERLFNPQPSTP